MKRCLLLVIVFTAFISACAAPARPPGDDLTPEPTQAVLFGTQFNIGVGEVVTLADGGAITFDGVSHDVRCPATAECAEMGPVIIDLTVTSADAQTEKISIMMLESPSEPAVVGSYTITLYAVNPYPENPGDIDPADYVATLEVTESTAQPLGEPFTLTIGESITLEDGGSISFDDVSEDSRCPEGVTCVWEGQVIVELTVSEADGQSQEVSITLRGGQSEPVAVGDYTIALHAVDPYPKYPANIAPSEYVATLEVATADSAPIDDSATQEPSEDGSLNMQLKLGIGETVTLADGGTITFDSVIEDSRCPTEVDCFWSGQIVIDVTITTPEGQSEQVSLTLIQDKSDPATVGAYTITLTWVDPYPSQPGDIDPASYVASIQLVKNQQ